ncbi:MAG: nucleotidyltransferase family protein [Rubripirellula sp.]
MNERRRCYAILPAAGRSRRMGRPKLLLPWGRGSVLDAVLRAWTESRVDQVVAIVRKDDADLRAACEAWRIEVVCPDDDPRDMKASVLAGLDWLAERYQPGLADACFIAPADLPRIEARMIDSLIEEWLTPSREATRPEHPDGGATDGDKRSPYGPSPYGNVEPLVMPTFGERPGHPALFPWSATEEVRSLGPDQGVDQIVKRRPQRVVLFPSTTRLSDIDTPGDYQAALDQAGVDQAGVDQAGVDQEIDRKPDAPA